MKLLLFCSGLAFGLSACHAGNDPDPAPVSTGVALRVRNASPYALASVEVKPPGGEHRYPPLLPGQRSEYHTFPQAYRYAYIKTGVDGEDLVLQPIDYTGERLLETGQYTYLLDVTTVNGAKRLTLQLEKP